jgi:hypothetical protein
MLNRVSVKPGLLHTEPLFFKYRSRCDRVELAGPL